MSRRRGTRLGYVVIYRNPVGEPNVVAATEGRIYPTEEAANSEALRLQQEFTNPFIMVAEVVLPPEPEIQVHMSVSPSSERHT